MAITLAFLEWAVTTSNTLNYKKTYAVSSLRWKTDS